MARQHCNPNTRKAYVTDVQEFMACVGITKPDEFRTVTRAHGIAWRKHQEKKRSEGSTLRRNLAALSSLFNYLCEKNAVDKLRHFVRSLWASQL
jgi:site-specific recombinase XerD